MFDLNNFYFLINIKWIEKFMEMIESDKDTIV